MARSEASLYASGSVGNNITANTLVALINAPGPGRYRIWGHARHSLADGLKLTSPNLTPLVLAGGAGDTISFGPVIMDITNTTSGINVNLNVATGASDTASATIYAEKINH
jgi:hypothetical protein